MPSPSPAPPGSELPAALAAACPPLPADLAYAVQGRLPTDSKMSEILVATDGNGQRVIIKIACVQQRARAETNCRAIRNSVRWLAQLCDHPGIAQMQPIQPKEPPRWRAGLTPPTFVATLPDWPGNPDFMVTEYLAGGALSHFVGKRPLALELALCLTHSLARTVADLHAVGCVHRDLKPENILFRVPPNRAAHAGELQPVLIDFGIAAASGEDKLVSGSPLWMAPELQAAPEKVLMPVDPTWDVYALGLICCYMLSGLRPRRQQYDHQDYLAYRDLVFSCLRQGTATDAATEQKVVAMLEPLLSRTLDPDPRNRPSAAALAAALADLLGQLGVYLPPEATPAQPPAEPRWRSFRPHGRWPWAGPAGVVLALLWLLLRFLGNPTAGQEGAKPAEQAAIGLAVALPAQTAAPTANLALVNALPVAPHTIAPTVSQPTAPPPTLALLPTRGRQAIPTLAPTLTKAGVAAWVTPPTLAALPPTATPTPVSPTLPPNSTADNKALRQSTAAETVIRLSAPAANTVSAQERVDFRWASSGAPLARERCYELVFWDPANPQDKRSPTGAGRATQGTVNFSKLRASADPLLRALAHNPQGFAWGVRLVACSAARNVLQDAGEVRHFTYKP